MDFSKNDFVAVGDNDKRESFENVTLGECDEIKIGMQVKSEEETYNLYNQYALKRGFSIRKAVKREYNGVIRQREFVCSKQGFKEFEDPSNVKKYYNLDVRTGCRARIRFDVKNDIWKFATPEERCNLRSGRKVLPAHGNIISTMVSSGIKATKSYSFLSKELGGANNVGFSRRDCHNFVQTKRKEIMEAGDGQSIINHFKEKQSEDPMFFYSVQVDQDNRIANFFWRDGRSKLDYDSFGDVVIFDTTYRTNKYNLICAPFVGINHHWNNVLFGCAFLSNETTQSFIWLFETFLTAMGGRQPKSIFTDQDQAMANAINMVFSESRHRLCLWHISKNAQKNLVGIYGVPDFNQRFNHCLYGGCLNETEFESTWSKMIEMHNLKDNTWLNRLYQIREKWCPTFNLDFFSAKMKSIQRSESTNSVFHQIMKTSMSLIEVIKFYEEKAAQMRQDEINEDFRCKNCAPGKVHKHGGILSHAAKVYTLALFGMFEEEFDSGMGLNCVETNHSEDNFTYSLSSGESRRIHIVHFNRAELSICCDCKLFETLGLLCCHALRVFLVNNVNNIPDKYISSRWTKDAKKRLCCSVDSFKSNEKSTHVLRMSNLSLLWYKCCDMAALSDHGTKIAMDSLSELLCKLEKSSGDTNKMEDIDQSLIRHM
ncbi:hypothetical protein ACB092_10G102300 [Castanea dentata]